jgi:hypothetical protein
VFLCLRVCIFLLIVAHSGGLAANFAVFTFAKREMTMNTLRKMKSIKTVLSNTCFIQITKSNQYLV